MFGIPLTVEYGDLPAGDYGGRVISGDKAKRFLGWDAETQFADGLRRYVDWFLRTTSDGAPGR
jgi:nucleoside-diphosphate-sugar epimerase